MRIAYLPEAKQELSEALDYILLNYVADAGGWFLDDVAEAERLIIMFPRSGAIVTGKARRFILKRFPYQLIYRVEGDGIRIYAVAHHKRKPRYWRKRLGQ